MLALVAEVRSELTGFGPLEPLLADPEVSDVLVNGPGEVWVDRGGGVTRVDVRFRDEAAVRRLAQRLAASAGRRLDVARPTVDARLRRGSAAARRAAAGVPGRDPAQPAGRAAAHLHLGRAGGPARPWPPGSPGCSTTW